MAYSAKIILDSVNNNGNRLITVEATYPRCIHSELMTHRLFSRNAASSRAIPITKMLAQITNDPFIPEKFGINQSGMQSQQFHEGQAHEDCVKEWLAAKNDAYNHVNKLLELKVHKQLANRILEPFSWITVIITSTNWDNFFKLRCNPAAQGEIQKIAYMIKNAIDSSNPKIIEHGSWHMPYIYKEDWELLDAYNGKTVSQETNWKHYMECEIELKKISVARCARVSYLTHDNKRDLEADLKLFEKLNNEKHMSPFEHVARPAENDENSLTGNFEGWVQYRKLMDNESVTQSLYQINN